MILGLMTARTMILDLMTKVDLIPDTITKTVMPDMLSAIITESGLTLDLIDMIIEMVGIDMIIAGLVPTKIRHYTKMGVSIIAN